MKILSRLKELEKRGKSEIRFGIVRAKNNDVGLVEVTSSHPTNRKLTKTEESRRAGMQAYANAINNPAPNRNVHDFE